MGKFLNTTMTNTVNSLVDGINHRLDSPFYTFTDKHPTVCTFYNLNDTKSTLDEGSEQYADIASEDSPLKYNKISNVFLYNIDRISTELDIGDYGLEANEIGGEAILPPNSFMPYVDSYFTIDHIKSGKYWFRITKVTSDTLENGSNFWKMEYTLDDVGDRQIPIVKNFKYIVDNVGSNYKAVIEDESFEFIERLEQVTQTLRDYYCEIFFKDSLQTFTYKYEDVDFYDPEAIEFMIRNKVMVGGKYIFVNQATTLPDTFSIQYNKSIYRYVERCKPELVFRRYYGLVNEDPMSLLATRLEDYYIVTPNPHLKLLAEPIDTFSEYFVGAVLKNTKFKDDLAFYNIISNYFHDKKDLTDDMIDSLEDIEYMDSTELYHTIPIIIFILDKEIEKLICLKDTSKKLM